jgi:WD40 repeat protein
MEVVKGIPITEFCDKNKLTTRQRLELFIPVCNAIQHAHMKGIIHRDIKPSNVLIALYDGKPVPKVIDFGVAKAMAEPLTQRTLFTQIGQVVGTVEYMSPEQATLNQLDIDTRSDIYSLGVLLYELLTGVTPIDKDKLRSLAFDQMLRTIREEEPPRPSVRLSSAAGALAMAAAYRGSDSQKLLGLLRGELDWIVMKCLEKERDRRFLTAGSLAQDIERHLRDEPVTACPPSLGYRLRKAYRKNRAGILVAAVFSCLLLAGIAATSWQAIRATEAEGNALAGLDKAEKARKEAEDAQQREAKERAEAQKQRNEANAANDKLITAEAQLRKTLYAAHMILAHQAWQAGGNRRVRELLEKHGPKVDQIDLRGFEWYYLYRLSHTELITIIEGHSDVVQGVSYSPDGTRLAIALANGTVKVRDIQTGQEMILEDRAGTILFSPDSARLVTASSNLGKHDGEVKIWDAQTGKKLLTLNGDSWIGKNVAFSPDGKRLATTGNPEGKAHVLTVWDLQTGKPFLSLDHEHDLVCGVAFNSDGSRLVSVGGGSGRLPMSAAVIGAVKVWDAKSGESLLTFNSNTSRIRSVAFSPDDKRLAATSTLEKTVAVWDAKTGKEVFTLKGHTDRVNDVAYSPDGKQIATASADWTVKLWDAQTGEELHTFKGHAGAVLSVAFSPDSKHLATASVDRAVMLWEVQATPQPRTFKPKVAARPGGFAVLVDRLTFSQDGMRLLTSSGGNLTVWDMQTGQALFTRPDGPSHMAVSADGKRLATAFGGSGFLKKHGRDGEVAVWDVETGQKLGSADGDGANSLRATVAFNEDGTRLARGTSQALTVFDTETLKVLLTIPIGVYGPTFSPDGKRLAGLDLLDKEMVNVWDAQTGKQLLALKVRRGLLPRLAFSPDGKRLVNGDIKNGTATIWDAVTGLEISTIKAHFGMSSTVAFSLDSKCLAINGKVWDAQTGQELLTLRGHAGEVNNTVFSPDGKRLASAATDATVKVWDAQTGEELLTLEGHNGTQNGVAFSPDGHLLAAGAADGTVKIYDATLPAIAGPP